MLELGERATLPAVLDCDDIAFEPRAVAPGVDAARIELEPALRAYVARHLRSRALARAVAQSSALSRFFHAAPGVPETLILATICARLDEQTGGARRWDRVLVDLDATGHVLMLLEVPRVLEGLLGAGRLRRLVGDGAARLANPDLTQLHLVAIPEPLVVSETLALRDRLVSEHAVPLGSVLVNRMPAPIGELLGELPALEERARRTSDAALVEDVALAQREVSRYQRAQHEVTRLAATGGTTPLLLPEFDDTVELPTELGRFLLESER